MRFRINQRISENTPGAHDANNNTYNSDFGVRSMQTIRAPSSAEMALCFRNETKLNGMSLACSPCSRYPTPIVEGSRACEIQIALQVTGNNIRNWDNTLHAYLNALNRKYVIQAFITHVYRMSNRDVPVYCTRVSNKNAPIFIRETLHFTIISSTGNCILF